MTLTQLQYVLAVAEYKNFTVAADKSFVSQPTLSMQVQKLEKELEVELFDRASNPIKITLAGQQIVNQAKIILNESRRLVQLVEENKKSMNGKVIVGIIPTILPTLVPLFFKTFKVKYPESGLVIKELKTFDMLKALKDGTIDFGIACTPLRDFQIAEKPLYQEPLVAYISTNHPLYKKKTIEVADLDFNDMLLLEEGHCFRDNVLDLCQNPDQINFKIKLESGSFSTLVSLVDEGYGLTILPLMEAENLHENCKKNVRYFQSSPLRDISLIYSVTQIRETFIEKFSELIKSLLRGQMFLQEKSDKPKIIIL